MSSSIPIAAPSAVARPPVSLPAILISIVALGAAPAWWFVANSRLAADARAQDEAAVAGALAPFEYLHGQLQANLRNQCNLLSEDPRLKSTLATDGVDEATIVDILKDLQHGGGQEVLAVLTPAARVQAVVGADNFRGVDLSTSSVVRAARQSPSAVAGLWAVGDKVLDLSVAALRFDDRIVAYLIVGSGLKKEALAAAQQFSGTGAAIIMENRVLLASSDDPTFKAAFEAAANEGAAHETELTQVAGAPFFTRLVDIKDSVPPVRLAFARPADQTQAALGGLRMLLIIPVVIVVVLSALLAMRAFGRSPTGASTH